MKTTLSAPHSGAQGLSQDVLLVRQDLRAASQNELGRLNAGWLEGRIVQGQDSLWWVFEKGMGGYALRVGYAPSGFTDLRIKHLSEQSASFELVGAFGVSRTDLRVLENSPAMRATITLRPRKDLLLSHWPRDLYPFAESDPGVSEGEIHATQNGLNSGIVYAAMKRPELGSFLYFQNFTALNPYFLATETSPKNVVGGIWPELGYLPPVSTSKPLEAGTECVMSDVLLSFDKHRLDEHLEVSETFLEHLARLYLYLDRPTTQFFDWPRLAKSTLRDLEKSDKARIVHWNSLYLHPYVDAEYPDSMCQLNVLEGVNEYGRWLKRELPLSDELKAGLSRFYDRELNYVRRYLPNVGDDKDADEVDTWYMFHPLFNLGKMAKAGDEEARKLFLDSMDYVVRVGQTLNYEFPVHFKASTLEVTKQERHPGQPGQSDAVSLYAWIMMDAWEFTEEERFLEEAKRALVAVQNLGFNLAYQMNITATGIPSCLRLYQITRDRQFLRQASQFAANFLHNCIFWESELGGAKHYPVFMGATCLHDGPYMSMFECHESFEAMTSALELGEDDISDELKLFLSEYCKYTMTRAWFYYPKHLPEETVSKEFRNGHVDPKLAFPLEDLYADGTPAGAVGQEIYGCGAPFEILARSFHRLESAPFTLASEYPLAQLEELEDEVRFKVLGSPKGTCTYRLIPNQPAKAVKIDACMEGESLPFLPDESGFTPCLSAQVHGGANVRLRWAR